MQRQNKMISKIEKFEFLFSLINMKNNKIDNQFPLSQIDIWKRTQIWTLSRLLLLIWRECTFQCVHLTIRLTARHFVRSFEAGDTRMLQDSVSKILNMEMPFLFIMGMMNPVYCVVCNCDIDMERIQRLCSLRIFIYIL